MRKGSWALKVMALGFAILTYFAVRHEIAMKEKKFTDPSYKLIKLTSKKIPLKVRLANAPPAGFYVVQNKIASNPKDVIVIGPEALLEESEFAETAMVDISENTRTLTRKISVEKVGGIQLAGTPYLVDVTIPIEKTEKQEGNTI